MKTTENKIIVAFHIGRGGMFYNGGHKSFIGELNFQDLQKLNTDNIFYRGRDERGRFMRTEIYDGAGNFVSGDDPNGLIGRLDFDGDYDTDYCKYIEDCTDEELELIAKSGDFKSFELIEYLKDMGYDGDTEQGGM